jgi:hypothetical protein
MPQQHTPDQQWLKSSRECAPAVALGRQGICAKQWRFLTLVTNDFPRLLPTRLARYVEGFPRINHIAPTAGFAGAV